MNEVTPDLLSVAEAISILDNAPVSPRLQRVRLESALGLVLAQDIRADRNYPPFDKSLMDGFAVRCADVAAAPVELEVIGEVAAGQRSSRPVAAGQAIKIMTGAPIPEGADGVVPVEDTQLTGSRVRILQSDGPQRFVARQGSDAAGGATLLKAGARLEAAALAVAGSVGASEVDVFASPNVAVLGTGNELVPIHDTPGAAQIRNSNNLMLLSLLRRLGCVVTDLGAVADDPKIIRQTIERSFNYDLLLISGGMSMGEYDFVPRILLELGVKIQISKLRIKPGKPFVFGQLNRTSVFGLPGNPVSGFVCALRLCSRIIARLSGVATLDRFSCGELTASLPVNGPREFYQPAILREGKVEPLKWKGSADIYTLARANVLIVRGENAPPVAAGQNVAVLEIPS